MTHESPRILVLCSGHFTKNLTTTDIYSNNCFDIIASIHRLYSGLYPSLDTYYVCASLDIKNEFELNNNTLTIKGPEGRDFRLTRKMLKALDYLLPRKQYDFVYLTTTTTFTNFSRLIEQCTLLIDRELVCDGNIGRYHNNLKYVRGSAIILSKKVADALIQCSKDDNLLLDYEDILGIVSKTPYYTQDPPETSFRLPGIEEFDVYLSRKLQQHFGPKLELTACQTSVDVPFSLWSHPRCADGTTTTAEVWIDPMKLNNIKIAYKNREDDVIVHVQLLKHIYNIDGNYFLQNRVVTPRTPAMTLIHQPTIPTAIDPSIHMVIMSDKNT